MNTAKTNVRSNVRVASCRWGRLRSDTVRELKSISARFGLSIQSGELQLLDGRWYITHSGLLAITHKNGCLGIETEPVAGFCDPIARRWVFRATVYKAPNSARFVGFGDADPSNVSNVVAGAEMRIAETRALNRAIRKAYGIGLCSLEELGSGSLVSAPLAEAKAPSDRAEQKGSVNNAVSLRDRLCVLIRRYDLDPELVKRYAASFCGTETLRNASRDLVEMFIGSLASQAESDRDALICKLNGFAQLVEGKP
jgi:hypothetical protein